MTRPVVATLFLAAAACSICAAARAQDKDSIRDKLVAAKASYDNELKQIQKQAIDWLDKRETAARKDGNKKLLDQVKEERKVFEEEGELPKSAPAALRQKPATARKAMDAAYAEAVKEYTKAKKDTEAAAVEEAWKAFQKENPLDLLVLVDPKAHAVAGEWKRDGRALTVAAGNGIARLQLPYEPGEEYDLEVRCRRTAGNDSISVGLVAGGRQTLAVLDGWPGFGGPVSGLDYVDKKSLPEQAAAVKGTFLKSDADLILTYSVRAGQIDAAVDGKEVFSFKGEFSHLALAETNGVPNKKALFLFVAPRTTYQFNRVTVVPVKGKGTVVK